VNPPRPREISRRNQTLGVMNGMLVNLGNAFVDPFTVLAVFITTLGGSSVLVGVVTAAFTALWVSAPGGRRRHGADAGARTAHLFRVRGLPLHRVRGRGGQHFLIDPSHRGMGEGCVITGLWVSMRSRQEWRAFHSWRSHRKRLRSTSGARFFGGRRVAGGILGVAAGLLIAVVLGGDPGAMWARTSFYQWTKSLATKGGARGSRLPLRLRHPHHHRRVISATGVISYLFVVEPPAAHVRATHSAAQTDRGRLRAAEVAAGLPRLPVDADLLPAHRDVFPVLRDVRVRSPRLLAASVGIFVSVWLGAGVLSNLLWGPMLDQAGHRIVFMWTAAISIVAPIVILFCPGFTTVRWRARRPSAFLSRSRSRS
jgi:hypothetical protein